MSEQDHKSAPIFRQATHQLCLSHLLLRANLPLKSCCHDRLFDCAEKGDFVSTVCSCAITIILSNQNLVGLKQVYNQQHDCTIPHHTNECSKHTATLTAKHSLHIGCQYPEPVPLQGSQQSLWQNIRSVDSSIIKAISHHFRCPRRHHLANNALFVIRTCTRQRAESV